MSNKPQFVLKATCAAVLAVLASSQLVNAADKNQAIETKKIEVISTTPLQGIGLPLEQIPANVQIIKGEQLEEQKSLSIADYINQNLTGVNVNETQNNPYQPDVNFHGYTASPLLGTPQGLSVFVDGVRVNEPFGDVVNWDLIPTNSINGISLIPGSNPLFGLNTLGGALSVQTKSGRTNPGGAVEAYMGSWGRKAGSAEYGGVSKDGSVDYFISGNVFSEDGWRDYSPSDVGQIFGKVGWQNETTSLNLSYTGVDNKLVGNGLAPADFIRDQGRESILTRPDKTENKLSFFNLNWSHFFNDDTQLSGNTYYRYGKTRTLNGDGNDDFDDGTVDLDASGDIDAAELAAANAACLADADADENCSGAINRTSSNRKGYGFNAQLTFNQDLMQKKNQFITGFGYDYGRTNFKQSTEFGLVNATRGIDGAGIFSDDGLVDLKGVSKTWSLFATDTLSLSPMWHLTMSARYNHTKVENDDRLNPIPDPDPTLNTSLTSEQSFNRINPAIGLNFTPSKDLTAYASYNEGSRAPTAIELGCANPNQPCRLPNAFAGDPPLDQVVAKTFEGGLRGKLSNDLGWSFSAYRSQNYDDIQFIAAGNATGEGYFNNVGKTRRQGIDAALNGKVDKLSWSVGYSFVKATYQSTFDIASDADLNSSAQDLDGDGEEEIRVRKGDRIPGIPQHQLKLRVAYDITPAWNIGSNIFTFSDQYSRGNENNGHDGKGAKVGGYTVVNLDTRYNFGGGWQLFAKVNNIFDKEYNSAGLLGEHRFDSATGQFTGNEVNTPFYAPGAPRAGWIGLRYEFGGKKATASYDND
jgi:outer membrane receptor protein involved in Fe transport